MEYALESSISINDEVLQKELSHTSDQKMKNIVTTIQKEQNQIIRNEKSEVLVIQGAAGSGKTSIALHRVAYFLYKYKERLSAWNIMIISPNKVFADYISNVLPELGEEPVTETGFEGIAAELLNNSIEFEGFSVQVEAILEENGLELMERIRFKSSLEFLALLEEYLEHAAMLKAEDSLTSYISFYEYIKRPDLFVLKKGNKLEASDVYPYLYLKIYSEGIKKFADIKHIVIDEMQDYTPVQYAVIKKLFPCRKTILGDLGQKVNHCNSISREAFLQIYEKAELVELTKSYRSTYEIIRFAQKIQFHDIDPIERHGKEPEIIKCGDAFTELVEINRLLEAFYKSGYSTLGIICRSSSHARELYKELEKQHALELLDLNSSEFKSGIIITTVHMSKGLEFDEIIIPSANADIYSSENDRSLLYIACTRAMHMLTLTWYGKISAILPACPALSE